MSDERVAHIDDEAYVNLSASTGNGEEKEGKIMRKLIAIAILIAVSGCSAPRFFGYVEQWGVLPEDTNAHYNAVIEKARRHEGTWVRINDTVDVMRPCTRCDGLLRIKVGDAYIYQFVSGSNLFLIP